MENEEGQHAARPPQSESSPEIAGREETEDLNSHEKPRASLHSSRVPGRLGRHSLDTRRPPVDTTNEPSATKKERSLSVPLVNSSGDPANPQSPPPTHAPTNIQSPRQNAVRSSVEFDRRFDGPFARPSLAMTRRISEPTERPASEHGVDAAVEDQAANTTAPGGTTPELLEPEPPPLSYTLHTRKKAIFIFWTFIIFDSVVMPIALYFGLWYGVGPGTTKDHEVLSANAVFSIVTAAIGGASILEYFVRFWRLYKKNSTCRVIGARRWYLDSFHWNFSLAWIIVMFELIM